MEGNYCVGQVIKGSDGISSCKCIKERSLGLLKGNPLRKHFDLYLEGGEREEGPRVLHLQAKNTWERIPVASGCNSWGKTSQHFPHQGTNLCPLAHDSRRAHSCL